MDLKDIVLNKTQEFIIDLDYDGDLRYLDKYFIVTFGYINVSPRIIDTYKYIYYSPEPLVVNNNLDILGRPDEYRCYYEMFDEIPEKYKSITIIPSKTYVELRKNSELPKDDFGIVIRDIDKFEVYSYLTSKGYVDKNDTVKNYIENDIYGKYICVKKDSDTMDIEFICRTKNVFFFKELQK